MFFNISELWPKHKKHSYTCVHSVEKAINIGATWPHMNKPIMEHCHCHVVTSAFLQGEVFNDTGIHFWHVLIHKILILIITIVKSCILITSFLGQTKKSDFRASRVYSAKKNPFFSPDGVPDHVVFGVMLITLNLVYVHLLIRLIKLALIY